MPARPSPRDRLIDTAADLFYERGRFLYRDDIAVPLDADLTDAFAREMELARERATQPDVISAIVGLDPCNWKFVRVLLSAAEPDATARGVAYQIAHLSRPLLDTLPEGDPR